MHSMQNIFVKVILPPVLIASLISSSVLAAPKTTPKKNNIIYKNSNIIINGKAITPKDANGKPIGPVIINGVTYVPVTSIADALGKSVYWKQDTNSLYISEKQSTSSKYDGISVLKPYQSDDMISNNSAWLSGKKVYIQQEPYDTTNGIFSETQYENGKITYILNNRYSKLEGLYGIDDTSPDKSDEKYGYVEILRYDKDGKIVATDTSSNKSDNTMLSTLSDNLGSGSMPDKDSNTTYKYQYDEDGNVKSMIAYDKDGKAIYQSDYTDDGIKLKFLGNGDSISDGYQNELKNELERALHGKDKIISYQYVQKYENPNNSNTDTHKKPEVYYQYITDQSQSINSKNISFEYTSEQRGDIQGNISYEYIIDQTNDVIYEYGYEKKEIKDPEKGTVISIEYILKTVSASVNGKVVYTKYMDVPDNNSKYKFIFNDDLKNPRVVYFFEYDSNGKLLHKYDADGKSRLVKNVYAYDKDGKIINMHDLIENKIYIYQNGTVKYSYTADGNVPTSMDIKSFFYYTYEDNGNVKFMYVYDREKRIINKYDVKGKAIYDRGDVSGEVPQNFIYAYDSEGNFINRYDKIITIIDGKRQNVIYDKNNNRANRFDINGNVINTTVDVTYSYVLDPAGKVMYMYAYDKSGNIISKYDSNGNNIINNSKISTNIYTYDTGGNLVSRHDRMTNIIYDKTGNKANRFDSNGNVVVYNPKPENTYSYKYNADGTVQSMTVFNIDGMITNIYDKDGYDIFNDSSESNDTNKTYNMYIYAYDSDGVLINKYDRSNNKIYIVDDKGKDVLASRYDNNGKAVKNTKDIFTYQYTIDEKGKVQYMFVYDKKGNLIRKYDGSGQLIFDSSGELNYSYQYDSNGQVKYIYIYNSQGDLIGKYDKDGKAVSEYSYNNRENIIKEKDGSISKYIFSGDGTSKHRYNAEGKLIEKTFYNSRDKIYLKLDYSKEGFISASYEYDTSGKMTNKVVYDKNGTITYKYLYDTAGNITAKYERTAGNTFIKNEYDPEGNLVSRCIYDMDGRLIKEDHYDSNGNIVNMDSRVFSVNKGNRPVKVVVDLTGVHRIVFKFCQAGDPSEKVRHDFLNIKLIKKSK